MLDSEEVEEVSPGEASKQPEKQIWQEEWVGMPEFVQEDLTSKRKIIVHFRNEEDVQKFAELLGQKITKKQPSLWYPEMPVRRYAHKRYVDES